MSQDPPNSTAPSSPVKLDYAPAPRRRPLRKWLGRAPLAGLVAASILGAAYLWLYRGWSAEQKALASLPGCTVTKTQMIGPQWLGQRLGRAGFVLVRVRGVNGWRSSVTDLAPVSKLTGLRELDLYGTKVQDLSPLSKLTGLQWLDLSGTHVQDLSPLLKLTGLQRLYLEGTQVQDLSSLSKLAGLQALDVRETKVQDLSPLSKLTRLQRLVLYDTRVHDLSPLYGLTALKGVFVSPGTITDAQAAELERHVPECAVQRW